MKLYFFGKVFCRVCLKTKPCCTEIQTNFLRNSGLLQMTLGAMATPTMEQDLWSMEKKGSDRFGRPIWPGFKYGKYRSFDLGNKYTVISVLVTKINNFKF